MCYMGKKHVRSRIQHTPLQTQLHNLQLKEEQKVT